MGLGHFSRSSRLAAVLSARGHTVRVAVRGVPSPKPVAGARVEGFPGDLTDAELAEALGRDAVWDWAIVDGYGLAKEGWPARKVLAIDDLGDAVFHADAILNQNTNRNLYTGQEWRKPAVLNGPAFALLDPSYTAIAASNPLSAGTRNLLVTLGASDPQNWTRRVLEDCEGLPQDWTVTVVIGPFFKHEATLPASLPAARLDYVHAPDGLQTLLEWATLVVTSASVTAFEACAAGRPVIAVQTNAAQHFLMETVVSSGAGRAFEPGCLPGTIQTIMNADVAAAMRDRAMNLVDGLGLVRVAEWLENQLDAQPAPNGAGIG
ncbi:hypothetical protein EOI86_16460 [Hwanghaeella grinnelliae]|uniref:Glycosyl transferase family 28 C-terminal domain-containing protein n=1 Tax=Hwanghaeella grinnelliae TaxID=2500179 RepID=A0A437QQM6_9PROT|nr:hypothetical protein [Hwanghaeella grinnelliae]RVU36757.1 hypothetical protein EOI86_16460 [Hwanghaeella grinnelliae]